MIEEPHNTPRHLADGRPTADPGTWKEPSGTPRHVLAGAEIVTHEELVDTDEATGTPPRVPAETRTAVYVGCLIFNVLCLLVFGLLPIFDILDPGKAAQAMNVVITAINLVSISLAVGYRPTRPGSPVKP